MSDTINPIQEWVETTSWLAAQKWDHHVFETPGTHRFIVPMDITELRITACGGGGGGAGVNHTNTRIAVPPTTPDVMCPHTPGHVCIPGEGGVPGIQSVSRLVRVGEDGGATTIVNNTLEDALIMNILPGMGGRANTLIAGGQVHEGVEGGGGLGGIGSDCTPNSAVSGGDGSRRTSTQAGGGGGGGSLGGGGGGSANGQEGSIGGLINQAEPGLHGTGGASGNQLLSGRPGKSSLFGNGGFPEQFWFTPPGPIGSKGGDGIRGSGGGGGANQSGEDGAGGGGAAAIINYTLTVSPPGTTNPPDNIIQGNILTITIGAGGDGGGMHCPGGKGGDGFVLIEWDPE